MLLHFFSGLRLSEQLGDEIITTGEVEFLGEYTQGRVGGDEVDVADTIVGGEQAEKFASEEGAGSSGDGEGDALRIHALSLVRVTRRHGSRRSGFGGVEHLGEACRVQVEF
jgi:hypothetical protein